MAGTSPSIGVLSNEDESLECFKCHTTLEPADIAMLIRTIKDEAFGPWCPRCTFWLVHHAYMDVGGDPVFDWAVAF